MYIKYVQTMYHCCDYFILFHLYNFLNHHLLHHYLNYNRYHLPHHFHNYFHLFHQFFLVKCQILNFYLKIIVNVKSQFSNHKYDLKIVNLILYQTFIDLISVSYYHSYIFHNKKNLYKYFLNLEMYYKQYDCFLNIRMLYTINLLY